MTVELEKRHLIFEKLAEIRNLLEFGTIDLTPEQRVMRSRAYGIVEDTISVIHEIADSNAYRKYGSQKAIYISVKIIKYERDNRRRIMNELVDNFNLLYEFNEQAQWEAKNYVAADMINVIPELDSFL